MGEKMEHLLKPILMVAQSAFVVCLYFVLSASVLLAAKKIVLVYFHHEISMIQP
jgi:hypothetical protein